MLLVRPECGLCEQFELDWQALPPEWQLPALEMVDVDSDPLLARRHGLDIPVLLIDGVRICQHQLDREELWRLLRPR